MKGILYPRNFFQFPLVNVIVNKIAYASFENTKNEHFFTTSHRKVIREIFFRDCGCIISIKSMTLLIEAINRTNILPNQTN